MRKKKFKKLTLFDLAASRVKNTQEFAKVTKGDLVEIISPFVEGENFLGTVIDVSENTMKLYHAEIRRTIEWHRCVNCNVYSV